MNLQLQDGYAVSAGSRKPTDYFKGQHVKVPAWGLWRFMQGEVDAKRHFSFPPRMNIHHVRLACLERSCWTLLAHIEVQHRANGPWDQATFLFPLYEISFSPHLDR